MKHSIYILPFSNFQFPVLNHLFIPKLQICFVSALSNRRLINIWPSAKQMLTAPRAASTPTHGTAHRLANASTVQWRQGLGFAKSMLGVQRNMTVNAMRTIWLGTRWISPSLSRTKSSSKPTGKRRETSNRMLPTSSFQFVPMKRKEVSWKRKPWTSGPFRDVYLSLFECKYKYKWKYVWKKKEN